MPDEQRKRFIHQGEPTSIHCGDVVVMDFDRMVVKFFRKGTRLDIRSYTGTDTSIMLQRIYPDGAIVGILLELCTGLVMDVNETRSDQRTITLKSPSRTHPTEYTLQFEGCRTSFEAGDRMIVDLRKPSITFLRCEKPIYLGLESRREVHPELVLNDGSVKGYVIALFKELMELLTEKQVNIVSRSSDLTILELMAP